jgi:hypothetical protein
MEVVSESFAHYVKNVSDNWISLYFEQGTPALSSISQRLARAPRGAAPPEAERLRAIPGLAT